MTRRERLTATLAGKSVDRPAVNFYEIGGFHADPDDSDEFNVYNSPSWRPLLKLAEEQTDLIRMCSPILKPAPDNRRGEFFTTQHYSESGCRFTRTVLRVGGREMTCLSRRNPDTDTGWTLEHFLKDADDVRAYLELPDEVFAYEPDVSEMIAEEDRLGDRGIVMVDAGDPLCASAQLFPMSGYTIFALTEPELFHRLLEKHARYIKDQTEKVAKAFPGRLWRIYGPEYAAEPYLPPRLFEQYVVKYTGPMVQTIKKHGGYARIHCHGRLKAILPMIRDMGADGIDPIEPPSQGDIELADVRREYGRDMVLFGNIEITDVENLAPRDFENVVAKSLRDGTAGEGRGFVLMPSACPIGREISARTMANYETMVHLATGA